MGWAGGWYVGRGGGGWYVGGGGTWGGLGVGRGVGGYVRGFNRCKLGLNSHFSYYFCEIGRAAWLKTLGDGVTKHAGMIPGLDKDFSP